MWEQKSHRISDRHLLHFCKGGLSADNLPSAKKWHGLLNMAVISLQSAVCRVILWMDVMIRNCVWVLSAFREYESDSPLRDILYLEQTDLWCPVNKEQDVICHISRIIVFQKRKKTYCYYCYIKDGYGGESYMKYNLNKGASFCVHSSVQEHYQETHQKKTDFCCIFAVFPMWYWEWAPFFNCPIYDDLRDVLFIKPSSLHTNFFWLYAEV